MRPAFGSTISGSPDTPPPLTPHPRPRQGGPGQPRDLIAVYQYDGRGYRTSKAVALYDGDPGQVTGYDRTDYLYNGNWQVMEERFEHDAATATTVATTPHIQYVMDIRYIDAVACRFRDMNADGDFADAADEKLDYTGDANMNVTAVLNTSGGVVESYAFDAYGKTQIISALVTPSGTWGGGDIVVASAVGNELSFSAYRLDPETGLFQVRHRYYDATMGAWISRDPAGYTDGMQPYQYCHSSPETYLDSLGSDDNMQPKPSVLDIPPAVGPVVDVGLYRLCRDPKKPRAVVEAKKDFAAAILARVVRLSIHDVDKWLRKSDGTPVLDGTLKAGETYTIPNLIIRDTADKNISIDAPKADPIKNPEEFKRTLYARVHNLSTTLGTVWYSIEHSLSERIDKYYDKGFMIKSFNITKSDELEKHLADPDLYGYGIVSHGVDGVLFAGAGEGYAITKRSALPTHHRLAFLMLFACEGIKEVDQVDKSVTQLSDGMLPLPPNAIKIVKPYRTPLDGRGYVSPWEFVISESGWLIGFPGKAGFGNLVRREIDVRIGGLSYTAPAAAPARPAPTTQAAATQPGDDAAD